MIQKPNVKSAQQFGEWIAALPICEVLDNLPSDSDPINIVFNRDFKESEFPHDAWSDMADTIYFAVKGMNAFAIYWRVKPELSVVKDFVDGVVRLNAYARISVFERPRPIATIDSAIEPTNIHLWDGALMPTPYNGRRYWSGKLHQAHEATAKAAPLNVADVDRRILNMMGLTNIDHLFSGDKFK